MDSRHWILSYHILILYSIPFQRPSCPGIFCPDSLWPTISTCQVHQLHSWCSTHPVMIYPVLIIISVSIHLADTSCPDLFCPVSPCPYLVCLIHPVLIPLGPLYIGHINHPIYIDGPCLACVYLTIILCSTIYSYSTLVLNVICYRE